MSSESGDVSTGDDSADRAVPAEHRLFAASDTVVLLDPAVHEVGALSALVIDWAAAEGIDLGVYFAIMRDWISGENGPAHVANPVHALERGELPLEEFELLLLDELQARTGRQLESTGLFDRLFDTFVHVHEMNDLVQLVHRRGIRTALLSNSWGNAYPMHLWEEMFDVVVISGDVGMRKPEERIFEHTCGLLDVTPQQCVFVDDMLHNVEAAHEFGMVGLKHVETEATRAELQRLFGVDLT